MYMNHCVEKKPKEQYTFNPESDETDCKCSDKKDDYYFIFGMIILSLFIITKK
jgi:hypothetical protein